MNILFGIFAVLFALMAPVHYRKRDKVCFVGSVAFAVISALIALFLKF